MIPLKKSYILIIICGLICFFTLISCSKPTNETVVSNSNDATTSTENATDDSSTVLTGQSIHTSYCLKCHGKDKSIPKSKSEAEWITTITRMKGKDQGHFENFDEKQAQLIEYLIEQGN